MESGSSILTKPLTRNNHEHPWFQPLIYLNTKNGNHIDTLPPCSVVFTYAVSWTRHIPEFSHVPACRDNFTYGDQRSRS